MAYLVRNEDLDEALEDRDLEKGDYQALLDQYEDDEEEFCPPGCDPPLYEQVCELREKRLDQEEVLAEFQKALEALKKENDSLLKKDKAIDAAMVSTESDIQEFQNLKQRRLNEIDVVVTLKLHLHRLFRPRQ